MKASELVAGKAYINRYGDESIYLGPWHEQVPYYDFRGKSSRKAAANDVLVLRFQEMGAGGPGTVRSHKVKGGHWHEEVIRASTLEQPLEGFLAKREHDLAVFNRYKEAAREIARKLRERGINPGRLGETIEIPSAPSMDGDWTGEEIFNPEAINIHLSAIELEKLLGEG